MKASEYRKKKAEKQESRPAPKMELTLPSGAVFVVQRPPIEVWIAAGKVPQSLLKMAMGDGSSSSPIVEALSGDEVLASVEFTRDAILHAVVEPRLVVEATINSDELDPCEIDPDDFLFLQQWIMSGCPGLPIQTKGGEVSGEALPRFSQKRPGGKPFSLVTYGEGVCDTPEQATGTDG